mmetsp:Transcript_18561/g.63264  ORF Transcript_18561/g.63264 Transcript_18561/m.63264 type:complete len:287 (+) Transcript_18561:218-1078(+)
MGSFSSLSPANAATGITARMHPTVLFNVADSYIRRSEGQDRVIGTLLGNVTPEGVEIKNCYAVPHNEAAGQVAVDIDFHRTMFELHQRVNPKEVIVGWYSTGAGISSTDTLIHEFYGRECATPVHLTVDTGFTTPGEAVAAYIGAPVALSTAAEGTLAMQFSRVSLQAAFAEAERVGLEVLQAKETAKLPSETEGLEETTARLAGVVGAVREYVEEVCEGRRTGDKAVGRFLMDTVNAVPKLGPEAFQKLFNDSIQDVLLVTYLSQMTRTQLTLAERLNTAAVVSA